MPLDIVAVPALQDNYVWLAHDPEAGETVAVDPGEAAPVLEAAQARGWRITQVWNTHWHGDHVGGNAAIRAATGATITGPAAEAAKIGTLDVQVADGDQVRIGAHVGRVIAVGAHTAGHIAIHIADVGVAFTGDTLFAMGCGRLFEGTPADLFAALRRLDGLPGNTAIYCGHEYTLSNARYAAVAEPGNAAIRARLAQVQAMHDEGRATLPTTLAAERETNPFLRARDIDTLARLRAEKDVFRIQPG